MSYSASRNRLHKPSSRGVSCVDQIIQYRVSPCSEAPGHRDTFEEHQEEQTHSTRGVLVKQLEHVDTALTEVQ